MKGNPFRRFLLPFARPVDRSIVPKQQQQKTSVAAKKFKACRKARRLQQKRERRVNRR